MTNPRTTRGARWLRVVERLFLGAALTLLGYVAVRHIAAAREQANLERELELRTTASAGAVAPRTSRPALQTGAVIGRLEVPRLKVSAIAREGADVRTLRRAIGHVSDTALPGEKGNAAFAGHRDTFFRRLQYVRAGDAIVVTTPDARYEYIVRETRIVKPRDVWVLDPTANPTLTLVTCHPFNYIGAAPNRFIVRAALVDRRAAR